MNKLQVTMCLMAILSSSVVGQEWTASQPGWLYVLDVDGEGGGGRILLVDPKEGSVKRSLATDYHPNFGLCPDGSRLYVVDGPQSLGSFSVYDTKTGHLLFRTPFSDRIVYHVFPALAGVGCSTDGRWVFTQTMRTLSEGVDEHQIVVINTNSGELASNAISVPNCRMVEFTPWPFGGWDVVARCSSTNSLRFLALGANGSVARTKDLALNWASSFKPNKTPAPKGERVTSSAVLDTAHRAIGLFRSGGGIDQLDSDSLQIRTKVPDTWERWTPNPGVISIKSGVFYLGYAPYGIKNQLGGLVSNIAVFRTTDWAEIGTVSTAIPFWSLAISNDGQLLYAVNPKDHSITVIDASSMKELRTISVGLRPALMLVQP